MSKEKEYCIYKHTTPNGKVYIGQTCQKPEYRWKNGYGYKGCSLFYSAIQKHGWENIDHEILLKGLTKEEANKKEIELISHYDSTNTDKGYNISFGGGTTAGVKCSDETKAKISKSHMGKTLSEEIRNKISESLKGHISYEAQRKATSEANHNRIWSDESKEKLRLSQKGRKRPEEQIYKSKETMKKQKEERMNNLYIPSESEIVWINEIDNNFSNDKKYAHNSKCVLCIETGIVYHSTYEASEYTNGNRSHISSVCSGKREYAGGFHWMFYEDYLKQLKSVG